MLNKRIEIIKQETFGTIHFRVMGDRGRFNGKHMIDFPTQGEAASYVKRYNSEGLPVVNVDTTS